MNLDRSQSGWNGALQVAAEARALRQRGRVVWLRWLMALIVVGVLSAVLLSIASAHVHRPGNGELTTQELRIKSPADVHWSTKEYRVWQ